MKSDGAPAREGILTDGAPKPIGPYSQAVRCDGWIFVSGQIPIDPAIGRLVTGSISEQTERVLKNVQAILEAAGSSLGRVVRTSVFLKNLGDFDAMNAVYARFFSAAPPPARSTVEVARLPKDVAVEIDVIARC
jgi:2-iminobutanoate/2-iminopropanoate deaminase